MGAVPLRSLPPGFPISLLWLNHWRPGGRGAWEEWSREPGPSVAEHLRLACAEGPGWVTRFTKTDLGAGQFPGSTESLPPSKE